MNLFLLVSLFLSVHKTKGEKKNPNKCFPSCPDRWEEKEGHCFLWPQSSRSWEEAEKFCNDEGGHLASVTNLEIHNYIQSKVNPKDSKTFLWIGGTDHEEEEVEVD